MKYVAIDGGLGNQMFQNAFAYCLKLRGYGDVRLVLTSKLSEHLSGFELERLFGIKYDKKMSYIYNCPINRITRRIFSFIFKRFNGKHYNYQEEVFDESIGFFYGTWQVAKYYENYKNELIKLYDFPRSRMSNATKECANMLGGGGNYVSVHIRRGDYLNSNFYKILGCCTSLDYYKSAISYIEEKVDNPIFVFFSDDMNWVKENIKVKNAVYVDFNTGYDSWQDMYLMSRCKHNITANSSFSWWGAWLNTNENKIVISPKYWIADLKNDDVTPETWIRL